VGDLLPEFAAPLLDGDTVTLASYRGEPVLVNLWATWCAPCREEMPYLESIGREYGEDGLRIVGISSDTRGALDQVRGVVAERGVTYDILLDPRARSTDLFGAFGLPVTFLADAEGRITWMRLGPIAEGDPDFEAALDAVTGGDAG
jgi:thiol-disulfide isomerase/thioredoxin